MFFISEISDPSELIMYARISACMKLRELLTKKRSPEPPAHLMGPWVCWRSPTDSSLRLRAWREIASCHVLQTVHRLKSQIANCKAFPYCKKRSKSQFRIAQFVIWTPCLSKLGSTPTPWSAPFWDHGLDPPLSTVNPMLEGFSVSGAPLLGFGLADHARPRGRGRTLLADCQIVAESQRWKWGSDLDPHRQPHFRLKPGFEWKFLLRRTWLRQKLLPLQFPGLSLP